MKKSHPQPDLQNPETQNPESLYAQVDKSRKRGGRRIPSPEEIQSRSAREPNRRPQPSSGRILYADLSGSGNNAQRSLQEGPYDTPRGRTDDYDTPLSQRQPETTYVPQKPLGNPYDRPSGTPSNGRRAAKLADPYAVVNLATGETESEQRINPLYDSPSGSTQDLQNPQRSEEHLYADLDFSENGRRSTHKPLESVYATVGIGAEGGRDPQKPEHPYAKLDFSENSERSTHTHKPLEALYAKVNKQHRRGGPRIPSPEEIQANAKKQPPSDYDTPPSQQQAESIYAPQKPLGNPYDRPSGTPSNGRRAAKLADPYAVVNLATGETESEQRINPLYDSPSRSTQDLQNPQRPEEHLYADLDFDENGGRSTHKPIESVYAKLGMGAEGGQEIQQQENPIYAGVSRTTTPPPRTSKDAVTSKLLKSTEFQYGVRETQEWCAVVYGNKHALNEKLAKVLDDPQNADKILWDLAANPESAGKLAGRKVLGIKSPDRKEAEDGFSPLCSALERHIHKAQKLHKQFTREQERDQRQESPKRDSEHRRPHHHHRHHARGQIPNSPEHSPQRQRQGEKGMAYAM